MNAVDRRGHRPHAATGHERPGELRLRLRADAPMHRFKTWQLFAVCVLVWGTTWHAITYQLSDFSAGVRRRAALRPRRRSPSLAALPLARRAARLFARRPRRARAAGRLPLRRLVRLRLPRRALRSLGAGRGRLLGVAAARRHRRRARCSAPRVGRRFVVGGVLGAVRRRAHLLARDRARQRRRAGRARRAASPSRRCCSRRSAAWSRAATATRGVALLAGDGLRHALRRDRRRDRRASPSAAASSLPTRAELVALARLPRARRLGARPSPAS